MRTLPRKFVQSAHNRAIYEWIKRQVRINLLPGVAGTPHVVLESDVLFGVEDRPVSEESVRRVLLEIETKILQEEQVFDGLGFGKDEKTDEPRQSAKESSASNEGGKAGEDPKPGSRRRSRRSGKPGSPPP